MLDTCFNGKKPSRFEHPETVRVAAIRKVELIKRHAIYIQISSDPKVALAAASKCEVFNQLA